VGTRLWLGDKQARTSTATVLDVHPIKRGERAGYRQRICPDRRLDRSGRRWDVARHRNGSADLGQDDAASGNRVCYRSLAAAGMALSPYTINGKKRWFLEPPHMQSSQVFLPRKEKPPQIGDEIPVELRLTTATVDCVAWT
jgi:hypothetical protein